MREALIEAASLLTALTTIGGLPTLMLEKSLQAQFLIPMATSITFGLAVATVIVLLWLPAILSLYESAHGVVVRRRGVAV